MKNSFPKLIFALALFAGAQSQLQAQTSAFSYQGRMTAGGTNFNGSGWFKFAVVQLGTNQARTATAVASVGSGNVKTIDVTDGGAGYLTPPPVTIYGTPGPAWGGATATASVSHGTVVSITVQTVGTNYFLGAFVSVAAPPPDYTVLTQWSNNGSSVDGSEPSLPVLLPVANGLFNVNLGASPQTVYLDPLIFTNSDLLLRIWFSGDGTNYQQLTPDQPFTATPYALMAANAANAFNALNAVNVLGTIPGGGLAGTYGSTVNFSNAANYFSGNGSNLTGLNASQLNSGIVPDARLASNVARLNGSAIFTGGVFATNFTGSGAGLTGLNGVAINAGTIPNSAFVASTVTASKIASGQVVKTFNGLTDAVTLSAIGNVSLAAVGNTLTLTGTATGVPWQKITATNFQAQPNIGYVVTNGFVVTNGGNVLNGAVIVTLPTAPNFGDIVRLSNIGVDNWRIYQITNQTVITANLVGRTNGESWNVHPINRNWNAVASSTNGVKLVATEFGGQIYTSTDAGTNWLPRDSPRLWSAVASSADGSKLVATVKSGQIYTSTDSGTNWSARASSRFWNAVASSTNGLKLVATVDGGQIYTSTDAGTNWTPRDSSRRWSSVASSADGSKLVAGEFGDYQSVGSVLYLATSRFIHVSTDSGVSWNDRFFASSWSLVTSSADGSKLVAINDDNGYLYASSNAGLNWTTNSVPYIWYSIAVSANGNKLVATDNYGSPVTSTDGGATWTTRTGPQNAQAVATSADGTRLVAMDNNGVPFTSADSGVTWTPQYEGSPFPDGFIQGGQNSALELQYVGNHQFLPISVIGNVSSY